MDNINILEFVPFATYNVVARIAFVKIFKKYATILSGQALYKCKQV
ncbi:hypothetical protein [Clostridium estertheticum]|nr:hypothetical protein [Clostridium estertheticum]MCB2339641.1 hypothetical protein [Clostridium estertheticum]